MQVYSAACQQVNYAAFIQVYYAVQLQVNCVVQIQVYHAEFELSILYSFSCEKRLFNLCSIISVSLDWGSLQSISLSKRSGCVGAVRSPENSGYRVSFRLRDGVGRERKGSGAEVPVARSCFGTGPLFPARRQDLESNQ